jgi:hypothetical protein
MQMDNEPSVKQLCLQCRRPIPAGFGGVSCPACLLLGVATEGNKKADKIMLTS